MAIQFTIIESATPPAKPVKQKKEPRRQRYGFDQIPVGGAVKLVGEEVTLKKVRAAAYQYKRKHPEWAYDVAEVDGSVMVYRLADASGEIGVVPVADDAAHYAVAAE